jgi:hypothetical protein
MGGSSFLAWFKLGKIDRLAVKLAQNGAVTNTHDRWSP